MHQSLYNAKLSTCRNLICQTLTTHFEQIKKLKYPKLIMPSRCISKETAHNASSKFTKIILNLHSC